MIGIDTSRNAIDEILRKSYDQYMSAAQLRNAMIREQLRAWQDLVAVNDGFLRLPFPGPGAMASSAEDYKELAVRVQNVFAEHSSNALELWGSLFRYQASAAADSPGVEPAEKQAGPETASGRPKTNGKKPAVGKAGAASV